MFASAPVRLDVARGMKQSKILCLCHESCIRDVVLESLSVFDGEVAFIMQMLGMCGSASAMIVEVMTRTMTVLIGTM